ncbi:MAG: endopeptidase La, partial [Mailhella sp.]
MSDTPKKESVHQEEDNKNLLEEEWKSHSSLENEKNISDDPDKGEEHVSSEEEEKKISLPSILPVLPLRGGVVFNSMIIPLFENREKAMDAVEVALKGSRHILVCAQR